MRKLLLVICIAFTFQSCSLKEDETYWYMVYTIPALYDKEEGGYIIPSNNYRDGSKVTSRLGDFRGSLISRYKTKGLVHKPLRSLWKISRNPLGHKPDYSSCGTKEPITKEYKKKLIVDYKKKTGEDLVFTKTSEHNQCVTKVNNNFKSKITYKYFYARMPQDYKIIHPKQKDEGHSSWQISMYNGRVKDLSPQAVPEEYRDKLNSLNSHKCQKYGGKMTPLCYDLPGKDENIYYSIRQAHFYKSKSKAKYSTDEESLSDIRVSSPLKWHEIKGMKINKEIYDYLFERCNQNSWEYCHLNDYEGILTPEQKNYIKKVKWDEDDKWTIKDLPKRDTNPWL